MKVLSLFGVLAALTLTACGSSTDSTGTNGGITGVAKTTEATANSTDSPEGTVTKASFYSCVEATDLKLAKKAGQIPGSNDYKATAELDGVDYAGFVVWPSGHIADVWIGKDSDAANAARDQYRATFAAFGKKDEGEQLVQSSNNVVVALDSQQTPTPSEVIKLDDCLTPTS